MIEMLKPIAFDVIICMTQLFDYYLYTIYSLFACDMGEIPIDALSSRLKFTIKRIQDNLITQDETTAASNVRNIRLELNFVDKSFRILGENHSCTFIIFSWSQWFIECSLRSPTAYCRCWIDCFSCWTIRFSSSLSQTFDSRRTSSISHAILLSNSSSCTWTTYSYLSQCISECSWLHENCLDDQQCQLGHQRNSQSAQYLRRYSRQWIAIISKSIPKNQWNRFASTESGLSNGLGSNFR